MPKAGGYRKPPGKVGASGPGKYSKRTDARDVPSLDNSSMQYGDVERLMAARDTAPPASGSPEQTFAPQGGAQSLSGQSGGGAGGGLPSFLFDTPTNRPGEDITTGMDKRIPDPNDTKELVLTYLAEKYGNATAKKWLDEMRGVNNATIPTGGVPGGAVSQGPVVGGGIGGDAGLDAGGGGDPAGGLLSGAESSEPTLDEPFSDEEEELTDEPVGAPVEEPLLG